jgi:hypothetical protein
MTVRKGTAAITAMGIAMVVAVFVMTMAIAQGFRRAGRAAPKNTILLRKNRPRDVNGVLLSQLP